MQAKLEGQAQANQMMMEFLKGQLENQKLENERLRSDISLRGERDFEARVLDMAESQALPAIVAEVREGRKAITTLAEKVAETAPKDLSKKLPQGPITPEESEKLAQIQEIKGRLRELAKGYTPGGNGHNAPPSSPMRSIVYD